MFVCKTSLDHLPLHKRKISKRDRSKIEASCTLQRKLTHLYMIHNFLCFSTSKCQGYFTCLLNIKSLNRLNWQQAVILQAPKECKKCMNVGNSCRKHLVWHRCRVKMAGSNWNIHQCYCLRKVREGQRNCCLRQMWIHDLKVNDQCLLCVCLRHSNLRWHWIPFNHTSSFS